jgi:FMN reductase
MVELLGAELIGPAGEVSPGKTSCDAARIAEADGLVIVAPVLRGTYPGTAKTLLDALAADALVDKVMAWVSVGASAHHYLGMDAAFRAAASWFGAFTPPTAVYLDSSSFDERKELRPEAAAELAAYAESLSAFAAQLAGTVFSPRPLALR